MRIDAHQHFWSLERGDYHWLTPAFDSLYRDFGPGDLQPLLARNGIAGTVAVQAAATVAETEYLLSLANVHPWILGVVGWIDIDAPDAASQIDALAHNPKVVGVRPMLQDLAEVDWILHPRRAPALKALSETGLVFDALIKPTHLATVETLAARYPKLPIVIDHVAKPHIGGAETFFAWVRGISALADHPQISCKLSGLLTEAPVGADADDLKPYVDILLDRFGADRLIWGSDWPVLALASDYDSWSRMTDDLLTGLTDEAIAAIRGGNARRIYNLNVE